MPFYQFVQIIYWLALSIWFGGALFVAIAAQSVFRTVREHNPILPNVLSVNLNEQHGTLLAGSIVGDLLHRLTIVELLCGAALLVALVLHPFVIDMSGRNAVAALLRIGLFLVAIGLVLYHWRVLWPRILRYRQEYIDHADEPEIANPAKEHFDREHQRSVWILQVMLFLLLGLILFSANISPRAAVLPKPPEHTNSHAYVSSSIA